VKIGVLAIRAGIRRRWRRGAPGHRMVGGARQQGRRHPRAARAARPSRRIEPEDTVEPIASSCCKIRIEVVLAASPPASPSPRSVAEDLATPWPLVGRHEPRKGRRRGRCRTPGGLQERRQRGRGESSRASSRRSTSRASRRWRHRATTTRTVTTAGVLPGGSSALSAGREIVSTLPQARVTDFTSHIAAIQQSKADLLMCRSWSGDATIIMKQAAAVGLFKT